MENGVNFLERWIRRLLALPPGELAARYCTPMAHDEVIERELEALEALKAPHVPPDDRYRSIGEAPDALLRELHLRLRGMACEQAIWSAVVFALAHPLPDDVAHDLVDRADDLEVPIDKLGHTRQSDAVQWRLAGRVDEALLTLGVEIYADPARDAAASHGFMERAAEQPSSAYGWLLDTLVRREPSSPEKERLLTDALERHPDRESLRALLEETRLLARAGSGARRRRGGGAARDGGVGRAPGAGRQSAHAARDARAAALRRREVDPAGPGGLCGRSMAIPFATGSPCPPPRKEQAMRVIRLHDAASGSLSFQLLDDTEQPVPAVAGFLRHLGARGYSPNTLSAYAHDLLHFAAEPRKGWSRPPHRRRPGRAWRRWPSATWRRGACRAAGQAPWTTSGGRCGSSSPGWRAPTPTSSPPRR